MHSNRLTTISNIDINQNLDASNLGNFNMLPNELLFHIFNYLNAESLATLLMLNTHIHIFTKDYVVNERKHDSTQTAKDFIDALQRAGILMTACPYQNQNITLTFGPPVYFYMTKDEIDEDSIRYIFIRSNTQFYGSFKVKLRLDTELHGTIVDSTQQYTIGHRISVKPHCSGLVMYGQILYRYIVESDSLTDMKSLNDSIPSKCLAKLTFLCNQDDNGLYSQHPYLFVYGILEGQFLNDFDSRVRTTPLKYKTRDPIFNLDQRIINKSRLFNYCKAAHPTLNNENKCIHQPHF